jgi:hypothetical protein
MNNGGSGLCGINRAVGDLFRGDRHFVRFAGGVSRSGDRTGDKHLSIHFQWHVDRFPFLASWQRVNASQQHNDDTPWGCARNNAVKLFRASRNLMLFAVQFLQNPVLVIGHAKIVSNTAYWGLCRCLMHEWGPGFLALWQKAAKLRLQNFSGNVHPE